MTPFEVVYGRPPLALLPYEPSSARTDTVDALLCNHDTFLADVRDRLLHAQAYAKRHYDAHHRPLEFAVGAWVWLCMLHRPTWSLVPCKRDKLSPHYAGPFQVLECVGDVTYHLQLPEGACIHDVFHIGLLKKWHGTPPDAPPPLPSVHHGAVVCEPERVIKSRLAHGVRQVLVQWKGTLAASATWEDMEPFFARYPALQLEDELPLDGGGDVMWGRTYSRRRRARDARRAAERTARTEESRDDGHDQATISG